MTETRWEIPLAAQSVPSPQHSVRGKEEMGMGKRRSGGRGGGGDGEDWEPCPGQRDEIKWYQH